MCIVRQEYPIELFKKSSGSASTEVCALRVVLSAMDYRIFSGVTRGGRTAPGDTLQGNTLQKQQK